MTFPARRNPRRRRFGRATSRPGGWSRIQTAITTIPAASAVLLGSFAQSEAAAAATIRRTIIEGFWFSDQVAGIEVPFGAFGVCIASAQAVAAGAASLPDPVTEINADVWRVFQPLLVSQGVGSDPGKPVHHFTIDSRVNYKLQPGNNAVLMIANGSAGAGASFLVTMLIYSVQSA